jgi:hypothetical protein
VHSVTKEFLSSASPAGRFVPFIFSLSKLLLGKLDGFTGIGNPRRLGATAAHDIIVEGVLSNISASFDSLGVTIRVLTKEWANSYDWGPTLMRR